MNSHSFRSLHALKREKPNRYIPWSRYRHECDPLVPQINTPYLLLIAVLICITALLNLELLSLTAFSASATEESDTSTLAHDKLTPLLIHLEQTLHFETPDGQNVTVSPGMYLVEPITQGESRLTFWNEHGTITVKASRTEHDQPTQTPEAHLIHGAANKDILHVVVFLPDGIALEATSSLSGIRARGDFRAARHDQLDSFTGVVRLETDDKGVASQRFNQIFPHSTGTGQPTGTVNWK
ncbi:hypothetical protein [uncultured Nitrospira sp.]|uniref:hypothetical protein n=1 Tax=uncultured Nitrospira sp. TaxID=157176 RepID=UPI00313FF01E